MTVKCPPALGLLFALLLVCPSLVGQARSWNGWIFEVPPGWQAQETPEKSLVLFPGNSPAIDHVLLLPAQPANGSLEQWFPHAAGQQAATSLRSFTPGKAQTAKTAQGVPTIFVTGQAVTRQNQRVAVTYLGMLNRDGQGLLFEAQFDTLGVMHYLRTYGAFVKTIEPGTAPPARAGVTTALQPPAAPGNRHPSQTQQPAQTNVDLQPTAGSEPPAAPNGHDLYDWFGNYMQSIMPGPNFTISTSMVWTFYRFFPNGYVYEGMPTGVDPGAINCPATVRGGKCLRYSISGSTLTIEGEKPHILARNGTGIDIDGTLNSRVRRADKPMSGTWKTSSGGGIATTVTLSQHMLTLRPDGTFYINGSTGALGANFGAYSSSANSGRYKLNGYTIEMDYSNGRIVRQSFLLPYSDDKVFLIGDSMYFVPTK